MEKEAFSWNDLLTGDRFVISPNRYQKILSQWAEELIKEVEDKTSLRKLCDALVVAMTGPPYPILRANGDETTYRGSLPPAIHSPGSFLNDHLLLTSAIAYALGYEKDLPPGEIQLLRLSALAHDLPAEQREKLLRGLELEEEERAQVKALWETLQTWGQDMEDLLTRDTCFPLPSSLASPPEDLPSRILYYAHLAASEPLYDFSFEVDGRKVRVLGSKALLQQHPLAKAEKDLGLEKPIGLVLGGRRRSRNMSLNPASYRRYGELAIYSTGLTDTTSPLYAEATKRGKRLKSYTRKSWLGSMPRERKPWTSPKASSTPMGATSSPLSRPRKRRGWPGSSKPVMWTKPSPPGLWQPGRGLPCWSCTMA